MSFLSNLFSWEEDKNIENTLLGRYSDAYKPASNYKKWEESILAFESDEFMLSIRLFLDFLKDPKYDNITFSETDNKITFEFFQGSKKITGTADPHKVRAESKIAVAEGLNIGLMRRLLDKNYVLKYARFALDDQNNILILFDSFTEDASPNKLYQALKEVAIQSDKLDDVIIDEFEDLHQVSDAHIIPRSPELRAFQVGYLLEELDKCFNEINYGKLNTDQFPGGLSYLLLALNYKFDYLLQPQGIIMDIVERNHRIYFSSDGKEIAQKNHEFLKTFRKIQERSKEDLEKEMYDVISTFGVTTPTGHDTLANFIDAELTNIHWYKQNNHTAIALAIPSYIVGFCLFNYAMPLPDMELLHLYYKVVEQDFFRITDGEKKYYTGNRINARLVKKEIEQIIEKYVHLFPSMNVDMSILDFKDLVSFAESFLRMVRALEIKEKIAWKKL